MNYFKIKRLTDRVIRISGITGELMYLAEGDTQAALIDTGVGVGNLKELVSNLTDKPVFIILTHGHVDHAMGADAFETVYMNQKDICVYKEDHQMSTQCEYIQMCMDDHDFRMEEDAYISKKDMTFLPLLDGQRFELGELTLEMLRAEGHTPGMMAVLFEEERSLLLGDACNYNTFLFDHHASSVEEYLDMLIQLDQKTKGRYDKVYLSHDSGDAPKEILLSAIKLAEDILSENVDDVPFEFMGMTSFRAKAVDEYNRRLDGGIANIIYNKDKIRRKGRENV